MNEDESMSPIHMGSFTSNNLTPLRERFSQMESSNKNFEKRNSLSQNVKDYKHISELEKQSVEKGSMVFDLATVELFSNEFTLEELKAMNGFTQRRFPDAMFIGQI